MALLVSQDRPHLFVTPYLSGSFRVQWNNNFRLLAISQNLEKKLKEYMRNREKIYTFFSTFQPVFVNSN
jgi:hypothetical protein